MNLLIVRTSGSYLDYKTYNCQELGLAKALTEKKIKVSIIMAGHKEENISLKCPKGNIDIHYLKFKGMNQQISIFFKWKVCIKKINPDIIQIHDLGIYMTYLVAKWAKNHKIPCVQIQGNYELTQKPIFHQLEQLYNYTLGKITLNNINAVGYKTRKAESYIKRYNNKIITFPTPIGLDPSQFIPTNLTHNWIKELNLFNKKILLYIGSLEKRRNPDFLIKVLNKLPNDYVLLIAGNGPMENDIRKDIVQLKLQNRCFLLGKLKQNELSSLYQISTMFLLASNYEIYGMVIMEAMFFGVPVISTLTAGSESLIENNINGHIIEDLDENTWAKTIYGTTENSQKLNDMRRSATNKIKNELLWDIVSNKFIVLYEYAINQHKKVFNHD